MTINESEGTALTSSSALEHLIAARDRFLQNYEPTQVHELSSAGEAGSAGKTTTSAVFGSMLAQLGFTVELVDMDGQGNLSKQFGFGPADPKHEATDIGLFKPSQVDYKTGSLPPLVIGDVLTERPVYIPFEKVLEGAERKKRVVTMNDIRRCAYNESGIDGFGVKVDPDDVATIEWLKRIHIYPNGLSYGSGETVDFYDDQATIERDPMSAIILSKKMDEVDTAPHFRIYDLHGTKSIAMISVAYRVSKFFNCVEAGDKTTGPDLDNLIKSVERMQKYNDDLELAMILPCRVKSKAQRGKHGQAMLDRLYARHGRIVPDVTIRDVIMVSEAYYNREPLPMWVPDAPVTDDYRYALAWAFDNGLFSPKSRAKA